MKRLSRLLAITVLACFSVCFLFSGAAVAASEHESTCKVDHSDANAASRVSKAVNKTDAPSAPVQKHCKEHCTECAYIKVLSSLRSDVLKNEVVETAVAGELSSAKGDNGCYELNGILTLVELKVQLHN